MYNGRALAPIGGLSDHHASDPKDDRLTAAQIMAAEDELFDDVETYTDWLLFGENSKVPREVRTALDFNAKDLRINNHISDYTLFALLRSHPDKDIVMYAQLELRSRFSFDQKDRIIEIASRIEA